MNDPDNKLFSFLNAAPTSYGRFSSHFRDRVTDDAPHMQGNPVQERLEGVRDALFASSGALADDDLGIERRGVEVHLDWVPRGDAG